MSNTSAPSLWAGGSSLGSPTPTDIQDTQSSHSENHQPHQQQQQHQTPKTTEYKSNFKPFDQYVYNEITDSFVKQKSPTANSNNLLIESSGAAAGSNQDLSALGSISPALEVTSFEPNNGAADQHYDVTKEPWYKEVVRRNEKANEYRFKSEVGHSSPLLQQADEGKAANSAGLSNEELAAGSAPDDQQRAPAHSASSPAPTNAEELSSRRSYNFTPHHYKRDHLIATMANNNNFKLPKADPLQQQLERSTGARRLQGLNSAARPATSSARPLARTAASSRARSQTSRPLAHSPAGPTKLEPASKSNQSSPVKSAAPRVAATRASLVPARTPAAKLSNGAAATATTRTSARPSTSSSANTTRRAPASSSTTTSRSSAAASKLGAASAAAPAARPATTSTNRPPTARAPTLSTASRSAAARAPSSSASGTITITKMARSSPAKKPTAQSAAARSATRPTTAAPVRNSANRTAASRAGSTTGATGSSTASNEPKSIKSKALADAGEKAAALAAAAALAGAAGVAAVSSSEGSHEPASKLAAKQQEPPASLADVSSQQADTQPNPNYYLEEEPNLIITTTETGNMLADEIARAEKAAQEEEALRAQQEPAVEQPTISHTAPEPAVEPAHAVEGTRHEEDIEVAAEQVSSEAKSDRQSLPEELVNGLSGAIVSAEDAYEQSERDSSAEFGAQQANQLAVELPQGHQDDDDDDDDQEPYSLMPTTFNAARQEEPQEATQQYFNEAFKEEEDRPDYAHLQREASNDTNESGGVQYGQLAGTKKSDEGKHVEFDMLVRTKSAESVREPELLESRAMAKLESGQPPEETGRECALADELSPGAVEAEQPTDDLTDEPYEHLEPESELDSQPAQDDELRLPNAPSDKQAASELADRIEDGFEMIESDGLAREAERGREEDEAGTGAVAPEAAGATNDRDAFRDEKSDESANKTEAEDAEKPEGEERGPEGAPEEGPDVALAAEPLVSKTIDGHKLTGESDLIGDSAERARETRPEEGADLEQVFGAQMDDIRAQGGRRSIGMVDQQTSRLGELSKAESSSSESGHAPVHGVAEHEQGDIVNKPSEGEDHEDETGRNELLMNVADLVEAETRAKEEMTRKSELARQQSSSRGSLTFQPADEILLSADQLGEQFAQTAGDESTSEAREPRQGGARKQPAGDSVEAAPIVCADRGVSGDHLAATCQQGDCEQQVDLDQPQARSSASTRDLDERDQEILSPQRLVPLERRQQQQQQEASQSTDDLVNFGSLTPTQEPARREQNQAAGQERRDLMSADADEQHQQLVKRHSDSNTLAARASTDLIGGGQGGDERDAKQAASAGHLQKSSNLLYDDDLMDDNDDALVDDDDDEQQKLSNHLTNSDDDVILAPRNNKETLVDDCFSPQKVAAGSRYNEGAGLSSMVQQAEEALEGGEWAAELAGGASAAIEAPTAAENRAELATFKSLMPELHAVSSAGFVSKLASQRNGFESDDDDDEQQLGLNPNADPLDVAATLSASSSVAEEMLRLSRQASNTSATGAPVSKLADESRSDGLAGESFEKEADTFMSGRTTAGLTDTQPRPPPGGACEQVRQEPSEPASHASLANNNNNNETDAPTSNQETDDIARALVQRKASSDLDAGAGARKEAQAADEQPQGAAAAGLPTN